MSHERLTTIVMCADVPSDKHDRIQAMKGLVRQASMARIYTRRVLGWDQLPTKEEVVWWRPLLETIRSRARHQRLEMSGISALESFTRIWDERMSEMVARENRGPWSLEQIKAMVVAVTEYEYWLRTHFPEDFARADQTSN
jgi:hypothetical protein